MGSLIKWLLILVVMLGVLIIGAIIILPMVVDPNDYKEEIVTAVEENTGRNFQIEQDLNLTVFPWLGLETGGVVLGNAEGFKKENMLKAEQLKVRVKLMPLLGGNVEVDTLILKGLDTNLEIDKSGKTNWDDLAGGEKEDKDSHASHKKGGDSPISSLKIQGIKIENANVSFDDRMKGESYLLQNLHIDIGSLEPETMVPVAVSMLVASSKPQLAVSLSLNSEVKANSKLNRFDINDLVLDVSAKGEGLPSDGVKAKLQSNIVFNAASHAVSVNNLRLTGPSIAITGNVEATKINRDPQVEAALNIEETNIKTLAAMFGQKIETTDPKALTSVTTDFKLSKSGDAIVIDPLKVQLDDTSLDGYVKVLDVEGPVVRVLLNVGDIDVDRYMPPAKEADTAKTEGGSGAASDDPMAALRPLDLEADFRINKLKVNNARMSKVSVTVKSKKGVLTASPLSADLYEGNFTGSVTVDARKKTPKIHAIKNLKAINVGDLLKDVAGQDKLLGRGDLDMDLKLTGMSEAEVRKSLNGNVGFVFRDGAYKGVNIAEMLRNAKSALSGGSSAASDDNAQTDFSVLSATATIKNGLINNQDLSAQSPLLRISGKGKVNLPANTLDYLLTTELVSSLKGQGGKDATDLSGIPIPVRISGSLNDPSFKPDLSGALDAKAKQKIDAKKEEVKEKAKDKLKEKLGDFGGIKGLFGR